jgi:hypothetical protein
LGPSISIRLHPEDGFTVRISENARRSVLFFGTPDPAKNGQVMYGGTAFLVLHKEDGVTTCYLVTAKHVAVRVGLDSEVVLRVNKKGGGSEPFTVDNVRWSLHPDKNVDVAAMPCYLNPKEYDVAYLALADTGAQLLGVYSGAWDGEPGAVTVADRNLKPDRRVPVGMGIVVPCEHITELLMSDNKLKTHRKEARERHVDSIAAVTDSALDRDVAPPATDANPTHLEDFTRLVDVAARKRPQGGQT